MKIFYLSGYTKNRLNNLSETEVIKAGRKTGTSDGVRIGPWTAHWARSAFIWGKLRLFRFGV